MTLTDNQLLMLQRIGESPHGCAVPALHGNWYAQLLDSYPADELWAIGPSNRVDAPDLRVDSIASLPELLRAGYIAILPAAVGPGNEHVLGLDPELDRNNDVIVITRKALDLILPNIVEDATTPTEGAPS